MPAPIDVNTVIGPWTSDDHEAWDVDALLAHLERADAGAALVRHSVAIRYDPATGNDRLLAELAGHPRLWPAFVLGPLDGGEHGPVRSLPERLAMVGVLAVWLYPHSHGWSLTGAEADTLVDVLRRAGLPVFLDSDEAGWSDVAALADRAPELDIVVCTVGYRTLRQLLPVLDRHPRVHVDLSYLAGHGALELLAARYGAGRLVFGTGAPIRDGIAPLALLERSDLGAADRAAIGWGTALRLLRKEDAGGTDSRAELPDQLTASWPTDIVDAHAHIGSWPNAWLPHPGADDLVLAMDRAGTTQAVVSSMQALWADPMAGNAEVLTAAQRHAGRLYAYLVADPHRPQDADLLDAQLRSPAAVGLKVHPHTHACAIDDERYDWVWRLAEKHRTTVLGHTFAETPHSDPRQYGSVAERHPELTILLGHSGATPEGFRRTIEVACRSPNLYAETCGSWMTGRWLGRLVDALGANRVVHGSDACLIDQRYSIGRVLGSPLSAGQRALVLAGNARRLLQIPVRPSPQQQEVPCS